MLADPWTLSGQVVLLSDTLRVDAYREAIAKKVEPGDVVVDLGSGTGVMARFAALAGASRVIAVEEGLDLCELNEHTNQLLGLDRVIEVVHGRAEDVRLRHSVDVVISELIGDLVDDEGMSQVLTSFRAAHRKHLRSEVRFIPEEVVLFGQVVEAGDGAALDDEVDEEAETAFQRALAGELRVLTHLEGLTTFGQPVRLLHVDGTGRRSGGRGEPVADFDATGLSVSPRAMACWFEAVLAEGVRLDSRGNSHVRTSWGLPLVPVVSDAAVDEVLPGDLELSFRLDRTKGGDLNVEARLG
jgi:hypothetical protein